MRTHLCLLAVKCQCRLSTEALQVNVPDPLDADAIQNEGGGQVNLHVEAMNHNQRRVQHRNNSSLCQVPVRNLHFPARDRSPHVLRTAPEE